MNLLLTILTLSGMSTSGSLRVKHATRRRDLQSTRRDRRHQRPTFRPPQFCAFGCKCYVNNMSAPCTSPTRGDGVLIYDSDTRGRDAGESSQGALLAMKRH